MIGAVCLSLFPTKRLQAGIIQRFGLVTYSKNKDVPETGGKLIAAVNKRNRKNKGLA